MRILFTTGVWGDPYIDKFLRFSLPSQLAEGNLGGAPWLADSCYLVVTSESGRERLQADRAFRYLGTQIRTEICALEDIDRPGWNASKYHLMNLCQMESIRRSQTFDAIMFGYADTLWSSGTFQSSAARIAEGYDGVFAPGLPVREDPFVTHLRKSSTLWKEKEGVNVLALPPRTLVDMTLHMLHPMAEANYWDRPILGSAPSYTLWAIPGQGVALRAFHLHPVMIRTQPDNGQFFRCFSTSLDEEYVSNLFPSKDFLYFARDSDEFALCSLMQAFDHGFDGWPPRRPGSRALSIWAEAHASVLHREFYEEEYRLHHEDIVEADWAEARAEGERVARRIRSRLAIPDSLLALEDPEAARARQSRVERLRYWQRARFQEPSWLQELPDARLLRIILGRIRSRVLRLANRVLRRLGINLRRAIANLRLPHGARHLARTLVRSRLVNTQLIRRSDPDSARCAGYPTRSLLRLLVRRKLTWAADWFARLRGV